MKHALGNAESLVAESKLLLDHGFHARSFTLSQLASEELAKTLFLMDAFLVQCVGKPLSQRDFDNKLRDHRTKIGYMHRFDYVSTLNDDHEEYGDDLGSQEWYRQCTEPQQVSRANHLKNSSLYVGLEGEALSIPSIVIPNFFAESLYGLTKGRLEAISNFCAFASKSLEGPFEDPKKRIGFIATLATDMGVPANMVEQLRSEVKKVKPETMLLLMPSSFLDFAPRMIFVLSLVREADVYLSTARCAASKHPVFLKIMSGKKS